MTPLQDLLDRVEKAEGADRELDRAIASALGWSNTDADPFAWGHAHTDMIGFPPGTAKFFPIPPLSASLDAAYALTHAKLPARALELLWSAATGLYARKATATPDEIALALLAALLKALIAQGEEGSSVARAESDGSAVRTERPSAAGGGEADWPLPYDVTVAHMTFRKGVKLSTLVEAARRWHAKASEGVESGDVAAFLAPLADPDPQSPTGEP